MLLILHLETYLLELRRLVKLLGMKLLQETLYLEREFEQMELEYFVAPGDDDAAHSSWVQKRLKWWEKQGVPIETIELYEVPTDELAHYSKRTVDLMYKFPHGLRRVRRNRK